MLESVADVRGTSIVAGVIEVRGNEAMPSPEVAGGGLSLRQNGSTGAEVAETDPFAMPATVARRKPSEAADPTLAASP
jgi:hypothetical protein